MQYWLKIVFVDNQELRVTEAIRHTLSDDLEVLEVDTPKEVFVILMPHVKYFSCDATVLAARTPG